MTQIKVVTAGCVFNLLLLLLLLLLPTLRYHNCAFQISVTCDLLFMSYSLSQNHLINVLRQPVPGVQIVGSGAKKKGGRKNKSTSLPSPPLLFIAIFTSHRSPLSERLEQASFTRVSLTMDLFNTLRPIFLVIMRKKVGKIINTFVVSKREFSQCLKYFSISSESV